MAYLIYTHNYILELLIAGNPLASYLTYDDFITLLIIAGYFVVDLFFFIGGCVATFTLLTKLKQVNFKLTPKLYLKIILHRFLRVWPMYMLFLFFFWQVSRYMFDGPIWLAYQTWTGMCDNGNWVKNVFFIDNWLGSVV